MRAGTKKGLINEGRWKLLIFLIETYVVFVMIEFKKENEQRANVEDLKNQNTDSNYFLFIERSTTKKKAIRVLFSVSLRSQRDCYLAQRAKFWQRNCEAVRRMGKTRSRGNIKTSRVCQLPFCWRKWLIKQGSVATKKDIALIRIHTETPYALTRVLTSCSVNTYS